MLGMRRFRTKARAMDHKLPRIAFALGLSGLIPQILTSWFVIYGDDPNFVRLAGFFYAALILSFLGGLWWGVAATRPGAPVWIYVVAVCPSLIAFASVLGWAGGLSTALSCSVVAIALLVTPAMDRILDKRGFVPRNWMLMRLILSVGLGLLTLNLAVRF
jgi:Protein of unknown function (DUF3429)